MGRSEPVLEPSWTSLGPSWARLGPFSASPGPSWGKGARRFGPSSANLAVQAPLGEGNRHGDAHPGG
eukprot:8411513-Pyramimonas_sp.AAC.1